MRRLVVDAHRDIAIPWPGRIKYHVAIAGKAEIRVGVPCKIVREFGSRGDLPQKLPPAAERRLDFRPVDVCVRQQQKSISPAGIAD